VSLKRRKLGRVETLLGEISPTLKEQLKAVRSPDFDGKLIAFVNELQRYIAQTTTLLSLMVDRIKEKASAKGITVYSNAQCCHNPKCITCLGKYQLHFPYLFTRASEQKLIRLQDMRTFFQSLGFKADFIELYLHTKDVRQMLIHIYNITIMLFNNLELTRVSLEE